MNASVSLIENINNAYRKLVTFLQDVRVNLGDKFNHKPKLLLKSISQKLNPKVGFKI